jgi:hypothetical protein
MFNRCTPCSWRSTPSCGTRHLIAERIRSLGHVAPGSYAEFGSFAS